ncbi:hypothetical protein Hdeb2414_s0001g00013981 [Helianthus debilis subsp. tardiflorus]
MSRPNPTQPVYQVYTAIWQVYYSQGIGILMGTKQKAYPGADPHWCHRGPRTPIFLKRIVDSVY